MKKRFRCLLLVFVMLVSVVLSGCNLIETDMNIYLKKPVVVLDYGDKKVEISVKEYNTAFNNYGAQLMQQSSYSLEQAQDATIEALINKYVLLEEAKTLFSLDNQDKNYLWNETYNSLVNNLKTYEDEIRAEKGLTYEAGESEQETEKVVYTPYETKAYVTLENDNYVIKVIADSSNEEDAPAKNIDDMQATIFTQYKTNGNQLQKQSLKRYLKQLKLNEEKLDLSRDEESIFKREVERIYQLHEDSLYNTKLKNYYVYGDEDGVDGDYISTITASQVLKKYKALAMQSNTLYNANSTQYNSDMLENFTNVNYVIDDKYFYVSHILMQFTDAQQKVYDNLEAQYKNGELTPNQYQTKLDELYAQVGAVVRNAEGEIIENTRISADTLLANLKTDLNNITGANKEERKTQLFKDYVYKHNEDPGILNAEYPYIIGVNDSKMVESFTKASRELNSQGEYGAISGLVRSNYGIHIVFYAGKVNNPMTIPSNEEFVINEEDILLLANTKLNPFNNKTLFDKIYEMLVKDNYSQFESMQTNILRENVEITKYVSNYKKSV